MAQFCVSKGNTSIVMGQNVLSKNGRHNETLPRKEKVHV